MTQHQVGMRSFEQYLLYKMAGVNEIYCLAWVEPDYLPETLKTFFESIDLEEAEQLFGLTFDKNGDRPPASEILETLIDAGKKGWLASISVATNTPDNPLMLGWVYCESSQGIPATVKSMVDEIIARMMPTEVAK